jgi:tRNA(adenine34) deaminase
VGAIDVRDGQIVGEGWNRRESEQDPLGHAELMAIRAAAARLGSWRLTGCELHVTLEPCPMCLAACQQARLTRVIYGTADPKGGALSLGYCLHEDPRTNHRFPVEHRDHAECREILRDFFRARRAAAPGSMGSV